MSWGTSALAEGWVAFNMGLRCSHKRKGRDFVAVQRRHILYLSACSCQQQHHLDDVNLSQAWPVY
jgi:hypothetical protein